MPNTKCCVTGCLNSYPKAPEGTTWHPFPKNENLAKKWIEMMGENFEKEKRNSLICSDHFNEKDFKTSSYCTRRKSRILSSSAVPSIFKIQDEIKIEEEVISSAADIYVLPLDVWEPIFAFLPPNDVSAVASTNEHLQEMAQTLCRKFDFSCTSRLDLNCLLNYTLSKTCTSINLNHCYWLMPSEIQHVICITSLKHLHIIECEVDFDCIEAICDLKLESLSISYSRDWRVYFRKRATNDVIRGFRKLKSLEIFYRRFRSDIILEFYRLVLIHCKNLEHFKVLKCYSAATTLYGVDDHETAYIPNLVPKLKSLVLNLQSLWYDPNVATFVALILQDRTIPLQHVDFGHQSGYLFKENILPDPKIILDKSKLSLSCIDSSFDFWLNFPPVEKLISQPNYSVVEINNVEPVGFYDFARQISLNSGRTLKEIRINHYSNFFSAYPEFLDGLLHVAINCLQITVFDITGHAFIPRQQFPYISNELARKHKALLDALSNLKNLKKLVIPPTILHCKYHKSNGEKLDKAMPFWKVTSACTSLTEIRIVYSRRFANCLKHYVHEDSLYGIAACAKLKALHLVRFTVQSKTQFALSRVTQSCGELQELNVREIGKLSDQNYLYNKNIKIISVNEITCDKAFLNDLSRCTNLEKFYTDVMYIGAHEYKLFADVLQNLKNLNALFVRDYHRHRLVSKLRKRKLENSKNESLEQALNSITDERPPLFCLLNWWHVSRIPSSHLNTFFNYGIEEY